MTMAYRVALSTQAEMLGHFTYLSDMKKYGVGERFDRFGMKLVNGENFTGDCDCAAGTATEYLAITEKIDERDLIEMVTPNHYIAGIIDREIGDVWVMENTGFVYLPSALNSVDEFMAIQEMPTYQKMQMGYIKPVVYKLSDLQKGLIEPAIRGKGLMIPSRVKQYYMEAFRTYDEPRGSRWWTQRDDLPFLKDFKLRDMAVPSAEALAHKKRAYTFTRDWEAHLQLGVGFFEVDVSYDSERESGDRLHADATLGGLNLGSIKRSEKDGDFEMQASFEEELKALINKYFGEAPLYA